MNKKSPYQEFTLPHSRITEVTLSMCHSFHSVTSNILEATPGEAVDHYVMMEYD